MYSLYGQSINTEKPVVEFPKGAAHPGLLYDKFIEEWAVGWHGKLGDTVKSKFIKDAAVRSGTQQYLAPGLAKKVEQHKDLIKHLEGDCLEPESVSCRYG
ncbi:MAG: hypothetical protein OEM02_10195 [Desulfobulbaceae bacterium]|nr:hypothetical protein [Desulfobulbaceae bacterium]